MKHIITFFFLVFLFTANGIAQNDSLHLILTSEYTEQDSAKSYIIRIDFISKKILPVAFDYEPIRPIICCKEPTEDAIGIVIEKLVESCFKTIRNCAICDIDPRTIPKVDKRQLNYGDSISYKEDISLFDRYGKNRKAIGFVGVYRCRAWRYYFERGQKHKIYSNWLYVAFPKQ